MEAHLALMHPTQVNKITTSCEICSGPHDTQYCMEDPEQAFVEYASSRTDEVGGVWDKAFEDVCKWFPAYLVLKKSLCEAVHKELGDRVERAATTAASLDASSGLVVFPGAKNAMGFQKSKSKRRRLTLVTSEDEEDLVAEDPSKQGRSLIEEMDLDAGISLVPPHVEVQGRYGQNLETQEGFGDGQEVSTAAQVSTTSTFIRKSAAKDKGKAKMDETESPRKMKQKERVQISRDEEVAQKLQEEFDAADNREWNQVHQAAQGFTNAEWDDVLARVAADEDFVQQLQAGEKCSEEDLPMKLVELVNQRKKFFAQQRAEAKRNKPMTLAQQKDYMSNYIKNQEGGYSIKQLKLLSFEQVKDIFKTTIRRVQSFMPMGSELEVQRLKRAGQEVLEKPVKRQKIGEASGLREEQLAEKDKELSKKEPHKLLVIVPVEELVIQPLQVMYPIIDWEVYSEDTRRYWRIIRVGNHTEAYQIFADMLKKFDRDDLVKLWDLVKERFSTTEPTDDKEKELWVELKRLFEPDNDDILWKLQRYMHDPLVWRLYDTCGVHHVSSVRGHDIFMLVEKEYPLTRGTLGLMMVARLLVEADSEMSRELLRKIFYQANRPRQSVQKGSTISFVQEEGVSSKVLPCQLPPKELNPGNFTLPCTIGSLKFYAMVDLGASINVIPKSMFEHLKLARLKKTNMLVEMADMTKRAPIGIVENVLVKIDKFLFPSDFVVIDMLNTRNETMILGRPFLATIHAEIDVLNK
ncbi:putative reverse transcriptase domain-containing protein [Tanacetum coccineum]